MVRGASRPTQTERALRPQPLARSRTAFTPLVLTDHQRPGVRRPGTLALSSLTHLLLVALLLLTPLYLDETLPAPDMAIRAFFVPPAELAPPPPPPPPPPAVARKARRAPAAPRPVPRPQQPQEAFVAPITVPEELPLDEGLVPDFGGEGGVPGGVEGGVPGGVVGGIVGGIPAPPPPPKVVRVGGSVVPPAVLYRVDPVYPNLATRARVSGVVILEAHVGTDGRVKDVKVLRSVPLLDAAAIDAVRQWRYKPLLLNGVPTEFLLGVTVRFHLRQGTGSTGG